MVDPFPIRVPSSLPLRIDPCPIVEAIFETRFVSSEPWATMQGLLFSEIREKYPEQRNLSLAMMPEAYRRQEPALTHLPLIQFINEEFLIQLGPRVISLITKSNDYPGWTRIERELQWLIERLQRSRLIGETERLSSRYINFFSENIFETFHIGLQIDDKPLSAPTDITTSLRRENLSIRLHATNGAIVGGAETPKSGSVLDLDAWFGPLAVELFGNGLERFSQAHQTIKELFFGLMRPEMLAKLRPVYK